MDEELELLLTELVALVAAKEQNPDRLKALAGAAMACGIKLEPPKQNFDPNAPKTKE